MEDLSPDRRTGQGRYRFHDLVRLHASQLAASMDAPADRQDTVRRVVDLLLEHATSAEALLSPSHRTLRRDYAFPPDEPAAFTGQRDALDWLDTERSHLMAALRTAAEQGWDATAWQIADAMWPLFLRLRPYDLWIEAHELGLAAARRACDPAAESRMLTSGGAGLRNAGRHDDAVVWYEQALRCALRDDDRRAEAQALNGLGQSHRLAGRLETALPCFTEALRLREAIGYRRGAALTRLAMGDLALATSRATEALGLLDQARTELMAVDDGYDAARALAYLGQAHALALRDYATAERLLRQATDEFEASGSVHWQARTKEFLGEIAMERRDFATARDWFEQSLALYEQVSPEDTRRLQGRLREPT
jgi:tetratricopeptide (TPR) repeat protein